MKRYGQWWKERKRTAVILAGIVLLVIVFARFTSAVIGETVFFGVPLVYLIFSLALPMVLFLLLTYGNEVTERTDRKHDLSEEG